MIKVAENISKKVKAQRTTAIFSKVQQVNERVIISSEGYNSPLTPSPNIQAIHESFNANAKTLKKTWRLNKLKGYLKSKLTFGTSTQWKRSSSWDQFRQIFNTSWVLSA